MNDRPFKTVVTSVLLLVVLYLLSVGPALLLVKKGLLPEKTILAYIPIFAIGGQTPYFRDVLIAYGTWWDPDFPELPMLD